MFKDTIKKTLLSVSIASVAFGTGSAFAYEQGDIIVRGGAAKVAPDGSSGTINIGAPALGTTGIDQVDVDSDTQFGITATYMLSNNLGVELLAATPFKHNIYLAALNTDIASTKHLPPTITFNYHLLSSDSAFQPYVGAGLNYTVFFDEAVTPALDNAATFDVLASATGNLPAGTITSAANTKIDLEDSAGIAIHAGFDYAFTENIGINVSYYWIDINTTAQITTNSNAGQVKAEVDVDIDPSVYMIGATYTF